MPLIQVIVILVIVGFLMWIVNSYIPMDSKIKSILNLLVMIVIVLWLLWLFFPGLMNWGPRVGPHRY